MKNSIKALSTTIAATLVGLALLAGTGAAQAAQHSEPLTKTVSYADLNLDTESGARVLYVRLRDAAKDVCSPYNSKEVSRKRVWTVCVTSAMTSAAEQINKPMLTALIGRSASGVTG